MKKKIVKVKLNQIKNSSGNVIKYIDSSFKKLSRISEVYLSELKPNTIKAWKINYTSNQFLTNIVGKVTFLFKKKNKKKKIILKKYEAVFIPKGTYYGFSNLSKKNNCLILNSLEVSHRKCKKENINYK